MKETLRKLFSLLLNIFEKGDAPYTSNPLGRKILIVMSALFSGLAFIVANLIPEGGDMGYIFPVLIFGSLGFVGLVVGLLGTDRAVAKIWGNK